MPTNVRTTALEITKPESFDKLSSQYFLVRYSVPSQVSGSKRSNEFGYFHNQLKEQIDAPYYVFTYDKKDTQWGVYAIFPADSDVDNQMVPVILWKNDPLQGRIIEFSQCPFHVLLKLLQIQYYRTVKDGPSKFVGQNKCYVYAQREGKNNHTCLELELKGDRSNIDVALVQLFRVIDSARLFTPVKLESIKQGWHHSNPYFARNFVGDSMYFVQIKSSEAENHKTSLFEIRTFAGQRTTLNYHDNSDFEHTRGYLVHQFIQEYIKHLEQYGFKANSVQRPLEQHIPTVDEKALILPINELDKVWVYDNRLDRKTHSIEAYVALFEQVINNMRFSVVSDLHDTFDGTVLIIQDCAHSAFEKDNPLFGHDGGDPYRVLYDRLPNVVKQSLSVNLNDPANSTKDNYLHYPLVSAEEISTKLHVAIYELYLKYLVIRRQSIHASLPFVPNSLVVARRDANNETALQITNGKLSFWDLKDPEQRQAFYETLDKWDVDESYDDLMKQKDSKGKGRKNANGDDYCLIIKNGLLVEIESVDESVLYEYEQIVERANELTTPLPIEELKLWSRYNRVKTKAMLEHDYLIMEGLAPQKGSPLKKPQTKAEKESLELFHRLRAYDDLLDDVEQDHGAEISFAELTANTHWKPRIAQIFDNKPEMLKDYYQRLDMFSSTKGKEVIPTYRGIWFDENGWYVVGDVHPFKFTQARAHRLRKFTVHQGSGFDPKPILDSMSVQWVRYKQYTVFPYYVHLIDLYEDHRNSSISEQPDSVQNDMEN